jgi:hypothetical protein
MLTFKSKIGIIGINPFVAVPGKILKEIFIQAGKDKGYIPIKGLVNGKPYKQTLVKYSGEWRLYINSSMLKNSPKRIGELIELTLEFDPASRKSQQPLLFSKALKKNKSAATAFRKLSPSRQNEIVRYLSNLKSSEALVRNINRAIGYLTGKNTFVGRQHP